MVNRFSQILSGKETVFKNFFALSILQGTNFLIPLIIMPYLINTVGVDGYGIVGFVHAIMIYFISLTDYGFNVSATRDVSVNRENHDYISSIFNKVFVTKMLLLLLSLILIVLFINTIPQFEEVAKVIYMGFFVVLGQAILPVWFFQGIEKMKYITYLNLASKIIFTALIFIFIKEKGDEYLVLLFFGLGNLVSGIFGLFLASKWVEINFFKVGLHEVWQELKSGWTIFISNFAIVSYMNSNVFILGLFATPLIVGYYSVAEKIVMAVRQILTVFHQAIYPHICKLANEGKAQVIVFYKQILIPFSIMVLVLSIGVFIFSEPIIEIFSEDSKSISELLKVLIFSPFIVVLNIPAYQYLMASNFEKSATKILVSGSLINIILNYVLVRYFGAMGTAYSVVLTEIYITIGLHAILYYKHPNYRLF